MTQNLALKLALYKNYARKLTSISYLKWYVWEHGRVLINSLNFKPYTISKEVLGEKIDFYVGNPTGKSWYDGGDTWYDGSSAPDEEMKFVRNELLHPGTVVIECGAHHGFATILLSRWVGDNGKVIAVEPVPDNAAIIRKNVELNGLSNVTLVEKAAGANDGYVSMKNSLSKRSNGAVSPTSRSNNRVECITVDSISRELNLVPSLLKIDVEGFEYKVLEGSKSILSYIPAILLEIHNGALPRYGNRFDDLWQFVNPDFYDIYVHARPDEKPVPYSRGEYYDNSDNIHLFFKPRVPTAAWGS